MVMSRFNKNDIVVVADVKDTTVYLGDHFTEMNVKADKQVQVSRVDDLRYIFISHADVNFLSELRQRRDDILQGFLGDEVETIKILSEPEIEAAQALHISTKGDITLFSEVDEITVERPMFGPGSYDV